MGLVGGNGVQLHVHVFSKSFWCMPVLQLTFLFPLKWKLSPILQDFSKAFLRKLEDVNTDDIAEEDGITLQILKYYMAIVINGEKYQEYLHPFNYYEGPDSCFTVSYMYLVSGRLFLKGSPPWFLIFKPNPWFLHNMALTKQKVCNVVYLINWFIFENYWQPCHIIAGYRIFPHNGTCPYKWRYS